MRRGVLAVLLLAAILVVAGCVKDAPARPEKPKGPARAAVNTPATYSSVTTDPNQDEVRYVFDWGDDLADTTGLLASGDTAYASHTWTNIDEYAVRVRAQDSKGKWSGWSDRLTVTVAVNRPPDAPLKPSHVGIDSVDKPIAFTTSATDPDGDSVQIRYYFSEGQVSNYGPKVASGAAYTDTVIYSQNGWKVVFAVATDGRGDTSAWSAPDSAFLKSPNVAPYAPVIAADHTPDRGIADGPAYRFYASTRDEYGDSLYYRWYFDGSDSVTSGMFQSGVEGYVEWTPTGDTHTYTVAVRVFDQTGKTNDTVPTTTFRTVGEGEIIWGIPADFVASPAIGTAVWRGDTRAAIICGSVTDSYLYTIDAYQGFVTGTVNIADPSDYNASVTIGSDGTRYVGNENGWLYAISPDDVVRWQFGDGARGMSATPALGSDGSIYCGGEDQRIHKLIDNGSSRTEAWSYGLRQEMTSSPAVGPDGTIYCCDDYGYVYALSSSGSLNWEVRVGDTFGITASPAVTSDGTVYVATEYGQLVAAREGSIVWSYTTDPLFSISSSPIVGPDGDIYLGCDDGRLYRIDHNTHQPAAAWPVSVSPTSVVSNTPLLCADGVVYVSDDSSLYAFDVDHPAGPRWKTPLQIAKSRRVRLMVDNQPSPVVDQYGIIYVATGSGVFAVAGRQNGTLAVSDWPMFHHDPKHTGRFGAR